MWDPQAASFAGGFAVLRYDTRATDSPLPRLARTVIEQLAKTSSPCWMHWTSPRPFAGCPWAELLNVAWSKRAGELIILSSATLAPRLELESLEWRIEAVQKKRLKSISLGSYRAMVHSDPSAKRPGSDSST